MTRRRRVIRMHSLSRGIVIIICWGLVCAVDQGCEPGTWPTFIPHLGKVCSPCRQGHYCPDGEQMLACPVGTRTMGARCCNVNTTCSLAHHAVTKNCMCQAMQCKTGGLTMPRGSGALACRQHCTEQCPLAWVQTEECQCIRQPKRSCQMWQTSETVFECPYNY